MCEYPINTSVQINIVAHGIREKTKIFWNISILPFVLCIYISEEKERSFVKRQWQLFN